MRLRHFLFAMMLLCAVTVAGIAMAYPTQVPAPPSGTATPANPATGQPTGAPSFPFGMVYATIPPSIYWKGVLLRQRITETSPYPHYSNYTTEQVVGGGLLLPPNPLIDIFFEEREDGFLWAVEYKDPPGELTYYKITLTP